MICRFFLIIALTVTTQSFAAFDSPFDKTSDLDVGPEIKWVFKKGEASKTSPTSDKDGIYYQLGFTQNKLTLRMLDSTLKQPAQLQRLIIENILLDNKTSNLFQWCLNNQQGHNRFLEQGLKVKNNFCLNEGSDGFFEMKLDQTTYDLLHRTKNLTFIVKPFRTAVAVSFDVPDLSNALARLDVGDVNAVAKKPGAKPVSKFLSKPNGGKIPVAGITATKALKICTIKPPAGYPSIKAIEYICINTTEKAAARSKIAASVNKAKIRNDKLTLERQIRLKEAERERLAREEEKKKEAEIISEIEENTKKLRDEVAKKMIGVCKKKWATGEHRCYCEPYLEFAPANISSDSSCAGG